MNGSEQLWVGLLLTAIGLVGVVYDVAKRRGAYSVLLSVVFAALGVCLALKLYSLNTGLAALALVIGARVLVDGIKTRSLKTILVAALWAAGGVGALAGLYPATHLFLVAIAALGCSDLIKAVNAKEASRAVTSIGLILIGVGLFAAEYTSTLRPLIGIGAVAFLGGYVCLLLSQPDSKTAGNSSEDSGTSAPSSLT